MNKPSLVRSRWDGLAARERVLVGGAAALIVVALLWLIAMGPALRTLRTAEAQHRALDSQLQRVRGLQEQAQALQAQPKQNYEESLRLLELAVRQRLGTTARMAIAGERVTITLTGAQADALAQWLTQARVNARALPTEAQLSRNASGLWEGTLVLSLPPR